MKELNALRLENSRLRVLARQDSLTGLLNRGAVEQSISKMLKKRQQGVLIIMDVNRFKCINDNYGHLTGDRVLQEMARIIGSYLFKNDIVGRMGGDEFAVFLVGAYTKEQVKSKIDRLSRRLRQAGQELGIGNGLKITAGAEFAKGGEAFGLLYEQADAAMLAGKRLHSREVVFYEKGMEQANLEAKKKLKQAAMKDDMEHIVSQLRESNLINGAYCQDYDTFFSIYRFLERSLERTRLNIQMILLSITDQNGIFIPLEDREKLVGCLRESIVSSLRSSDIYTQYSSCQFLILTIGANREHVDLITSRMISRFRDLAPGRKDISFSASFYPLQAVRKEAEEMEPEG